MNSILKKTLLAMSVAAAATANAATITGNNGVDSTFTEEEWPLVSAEGLAIVETIEVGTGANQIPVSVTLPGNLIAGDILAFTFTGATLDDAASADLGTTDIVYLSNDADTGVVRFRVVNTTTAGDYDLSGIVLEDLGSVVALSLSVTTSGEEIDSAPSTPIAQVASEFSVTAGETLGGVIDVEKSRLEFTTGTTDEFTIDVAAGADLLPVSAGIASLSVTASEGFDFLLDGEGDLDAASYELDGLTEDTSETTLEGNTLSLQSTNAYTAGDDAFGVTFTADGEDDEDAQALEAQSYSADVTLAYTRGSTSGTVTTSGISVGAWTLSGATVNIPFMPYGGGISQIIHVSNDGSVDGDIELTAFDDEGNSFGPVTLNLSAAPGSITRLNGAIATALTDEGFDGSGNVDITLVINSPAGDVEVFAAYNVRGDRISVPVQ